MLLIVAPILPIAWLRAAALFAGTDVGGWYTPTGLGDILSTIFVTFAVNRAGPPWEAIGAVVMGALALFWILDFGPFASLKGMLWIFPGRSKSKIQNPKSKIDLRHAQTHRSDSV